MKLTIGKKLTLSFLFLSLLVLLSGSIGILILNKVSRSADTVAKEKVPIQYSVMKANLAVEKAKKAMDDYTTASSGLLKKEKHLLALLDEFAMWITMLEHGTSSDKFLKSKSNTVYKALKLSIDVPQSSKEMLTIVDKLKKDNMAFRKGCTDLVNAHNEYLSYSVTANKTNYDLPSYIMLLEKNHRSWFSSLENAVITVITYKKELDPTKGMLGSWIHTYKNEDKGLNKLIKKLSKYNKKILGYVDKINQKDDAEGKTQVFNKSSGTY